MQCALEVAVEAVLYVVRRAAGSGRRDGAPRVTSLPAVEDRLVLFGRPVASGFEGWVTANAGTTTTTMW